MSLQELVVFSKSILCKMIMENTCINFIIPVNLQNAYPMQFSSIPIMKEDLYQITLIFRRLYKPCMTLRIRIKSYNTQIPKITKITESPPKIFTLNSIKLTSSLPWT